MLFTATLDDSSDLHPVVSPFSLFFFLFFIMCVRYWNLTTASPDQECLDATVQGSDRQVWSVLRVEEDLHQAVCSALTQLTALLHKLQLQHLAAAPCVSEQDSTAVLQ